jgi:hypothetical protein
MHVRHLAVLVLTALLLQPGAASSTAAGTPVQFENQTSREFKFTVKKLVCMEAQPLPLFVGAQSDEHLLISMVTTGTCARSPIAHMDLAIAQVGQHMTTYMSIVKLSDPKPGMYWMVALPPAGQGACMSVKAAAAEYIRIVIRPC